MTSTLSGIANINVLNTVFTEEQLEELRRPVGVPEIGPEVLQEILSANAQENSAVAVDIGPIPLTNEMILTMVRQRMSDVDNQLNHGMQEIQKNADLSRQIAEKQQLLRAVRERVVAIRGAEAGATMTAAELAGQSFDINGQSLSYDEVMQRLNIEGLPNTDVSNSRLDALIRIEDSRAKQVNSGNEILMLQVQSLTQQRSQIIQMGTSLLKKLGEAEQAIARNI